MLYLRQSAELELAPRRAKPAICRPVKQHRHVHFIGAYSLHSRARLERSRHSPNRQSLFQKVEGDVAFLAADFHMGPLPMFDARDCLQHVYFGALLQGCQQCRMRGRFLS